MEIPYAIFLNLVKHTVNIYSRAIKHNFNVYD